MSGERVRVGIWGLGAMGSGMAKAVLARKNMQLVAVIARRPEKIGRDLGDVLGFDVDLGITVSGSPEKTLRDAKPDLVLHATGSFVEASYPEIQLLCQIGSDVISVAEEMAYPWTGSPERARQIDEAARKARVTVLGTGINPGFVLDTLILCLTGAMTQVRRVKARRVNDLSPFGPTVMRTQGVGTTPEGFQEGLSKGDIVGHIGFPESISMIAEALGWGLEGIEQTRQPIISSVYRETPHVKVHPGMVAGCRHVGIGIVKGEPVIEMEHPQQVRPEAEGVETGDFITLEGTPPISVAIQPEIPGGTGTIGVAVNMIPAVRKAGPGLVTMADLPVPRGLASELVAKSR